jgi:hypothetical protein
LTKTRLPFAIATCIFFACGLSFLFFLGGFKPVHMPDNNHLIATKPIPVTDKADSLPWQVEKLMQAYSGFVVGYKNGNILLNDSTRILFNDTKIKSVQERLDHADIEDMFSEIYTTDSTTTPKNDAGRIRNDLFFKKIYGHTSQEIRSNLVEIVWCPKLVNQRILVNKRNGVAEHFIALSKELDGHPEFKKYLTQIGGTFNFRKISGTNRLSMHSFGITIDINIAHSNYWQWDCGCVNEGGVKGYKNRIPLTLVQIFEKHGFIWGGRWKHYDTMHFEFRPELLP